MRSSRCASRDTNNVSQRPNRLNGHNRRKTMMVDNLEEPFYEKDLLGEILIRRGLISKDQLVQALQAQRQEPKLIGDILIDQGVVQEIDIVVALIMQCAIPYLAINKYPVEQSILKIIPIEQARAWQVIPLDRVGDVLSVVMANPLSTSICQRISDLTGCRLAPFIATKSEIEEAIAKSYV